MQIFGKMINNTSDNLNTHGKHSSWVFKPLLLSAPFGRYIKYKNTSSVYGSYTTEVRRGAVLQFVKTFRPLMRKKAFRNKIGLRNPSIWKTPNPKSENHLISISSLKDGDWQEHFNALKTRQEQGLLFGGVVLNLSCPNADILPISSHELQMFLESFNTVLKLSPRLKSVNNIEQYLNDGARQFIISNTIPTKKGGISGKPLLKHNFKLIEHVRKSFANDFHIVGAGGITHSDHIKSYADVGANSFGIGMASTNILKVKTLIKTAEQYFNPCEFK